MATREEKRLLRKRADGKFDALYFLDDGTGRPTFEEGVYDEAQARTAREKGWQDVDTNQWMASRRAYGPMVTAPVGKRPFFTGEGATHEPRKKSPVEDAARWAAGAGRGYVSEEFGEKPPPVAAAPKPTPPAQGRRPEPVRVSASGGAATLRKHTSLAPKAAAPARPAFEEVLSPDVEEYVRSQLGMRDIRPAQAQSDERLLGARLTHAGAMANAAIVGKKLDAKPYEDLEAGARQPVEDYLEQLRSEQMQSAEARAEEDQRLQGQEFNRRGAQDERDFAFRQAEAKRDEALARDRMAQDERQHQESLTEQRRSRYAAAARTESQRGNGEADKQLERLGQATSRAPFAELQRALEQIDALAPGLAYGASPKELPISTGDRVAQALPFGMGERLMSDKGQKYAAAISNLRDLVSRLRSGAVLNEQEEAHYLRLLGDQALSDPSKAAAGINEIRRGVAQKLRNAQAAYSTMADGEGSVLDRYEGTGASTYRAPIFSGDTTNNPTPTGRYKIDRNGVAWQLYSDGQMREVPR